MIDKRRRRAPGLRWTSLLTGIVCCGLLLAPHVRAQESRSSGLFREGDRIALVGSTVAERLQLFGAFEAHLAARLPGHDLTVRNLAWSADEVALRPRPLNFGSLGTHLEQQQADVALLFFGTNESWRGEEGLAAYERDLRQLLAELDLVTDATLSSRRFALVAPLPQEQVGLLPSPAGRNQLVALYGDVTCRVASDVGAPCVDCFAALEAHYASSAVDATINGVHLTPATQEVFVDCLLGQLGVPPARSTLELSRDEKARLEVHGVIELSASLPPSTSLELAVKGLPEGRFSLEGAARLESGAAPSGALQAGVVAVVEAETHERLRETVVRKDRLFFDRYRAVNGYYIYGDRREPFGVVNFPREMARFDQLVKDLDDVIHELAQPSAANVVIRRVGGRDLERRNGDDP